MKNTKRNMIHDAKNMRQIDEAIETHIRNIVLTYGEGIIANLYECVEACQDEIVMNWEDEDEA